MHSTRLDLYHKEATNAEPSRELNKKAMQIFKEAQEAFKVYNETSRKRRFTIDGEVDEPSSETFNIPTLAAIGNVEELMPEIMPDEDGDNPAKKIRANDSTTPAASGASASSAPAGNPQGTQ